MSTLYLQVDDAGPDGYPVRLGLLDVDQPGPVSLESSGLLPVALPPRSAEQPEGVYLHDLIADGGGTALADLLSGAQVSSIAVNVRPAKLAALPWEMMALGPQEDDFRLFIDDERPWSRGRWAVRRPSQRLLGPLRLLVVVCDPDLALRAEEELDGIHRAVSGSLGRIHLEIIDSPKDWKTLRQEVVDRAPHVVHFIGHSKQSRAQAQGVLEFKPANTHDTWEMSAGQIRQSWPQGPRLVVVSACKSSRGDDPAGVSSLTDALQAKGVPAVLGMRGNITSEAAIAFASEFYSYLADDKSVDAAAAAGRRAILDGSSLSATDWHFPVLETLVPAAHVLPIWFGVNTRQKDLTREIPEFATLQTFVDRSEQRRRTWWAIDPEDLPGRRVVRGSVLITGPRKAGKTWLAQASLRVCYWRGRRLHYIDLAAESPADELGVSSKDWLGTLRAIRDGTQGCHLSPALDARAFATFNARLNWLVRYPPAAAMPTQADEEVEDERQSFDAQTGQAPQRIALIFKDFLAALEKAAAGQRIVLALDDIENVLESSWQNYVLPKLIVPLANGVSGVSLLLIVPQDLMPSRVTHDLAAVMERVEVWEFQHAQIDRTIREFVVNSLLEPKHLQKFQEIFHGYARVAPAQFGELERLLRALDQGGG
jgi:CHAT domain